MKGIKKRRIKLFIAIGFAALFLLPYASAGQNQNPQNGSVQKNPGALEVYQRGEELFSSLLRSPTPPSAALPPEKLIGEEKDLPEFDGYLIQLEKPTLIDKEIELEKAIEKEEATLKKPAYKSFKSLLNKAAAKIQGISPEKRAEKVIKQRRAEIKEKIKAHKEKLAKKRAQAKTDIEKILKNPSKSSKKKSFKKSAATEFVIYKEYDTAFNGFWARLAEDDILLLKEKGFVVSPNYKVQASLMDSVPLIGADKVWQEKDLNNNFVTGQGVKIGIIDTGVDYTHPDLTTLSNCDPYIINGEVENYALESPHPYENNYINTWTITKSGFTKIAVHFSDIKIEDIYDTVYVLDSNDNIIETISNDKTNFWSKSVNGGTIKIKLVSNSSITDWGFAIDALLNGTAEENVNACVKFKGGYDFVNNDDDPMDDHGHGTHVAATAAGNGVLKGVAPDAEIYAYKVLDSGGSGYSDNIISAIERAADPNQDSDFSDHLDIINLSLGGGGDPDSPMAQAIDKAVDLGVVAAIAAGNSGPGPQTIGNPGVARKAITVAASDKQDAIADFSSRGPVIWNNQSIVKPDIAAPGMNICAAQWDDWLNNRRCLDYKHIAISGTSMATPHIAGTAALIKQLRPDWTSQEIKAILKNTAKNLGNNALEQGGGRVQALEAVLQSKISTPIITELESIPVQTSGNLEIKYYLRKINDNTQISLSYAPLSSPDNFQPLTNFAANDGIGSYSLNLNQILDGKYILKITAQDQQNNISVDYGYFEVDKFQIFNPLNNDVLRAGDIIDIKTNLNPEETNSLMGYLKTAISSISNFISGSETGNVEFSYGQGRSPSQWFPIEGNLWDTSNLQTGFYTLKGSLRDSDNNDIISEKQVYVYLDSTLKKGWPKRINSDQTECPWGGGYICYIWTGYLTPVVSDLNNDGEQEIITLANGNPPKLLIYASNGDLIKSVPVGDIADTDLPIPLVEDIDNNGSKEIIIFSHRYNNNSPSAILYILNREGTILPNWPIELPLGGTIMSIAADLDSDGKKEIIAAANNWLIIIGADANIILQWPAPIQSTPAVGNFDNDSDLEIVFAGPSPLAGYDWDKQEYINEGEIYVLNKNGSYVDGWPQKVPGEIFGSPAIGDLDNDGNNEIVVGLMYSSDQFPDIRYGGLYVFDKNGQILPGWPVNKGYNYWSSPSLGDFDNDGDLEIGASRLGFNTEIFHHNGTLAQNWPQQTAWNDYYSTIIGDVNNDKIPDLLTTAGGITANGGVYAWNFDGTLINGFPKITEIDAQAPATVADIDNDGKLELIASSDLDYDLINNKNKMRGSIYVWKLNSDNNAGTLHWPTFHHDAARTGLYSPPPLPDLIMSDFQISPAPIVDKKSAISFNLKNIGQADSPWPEIYIKPAEYSLSSEAVFDCFNKDGGSLGSPKILAISNNTVAAASTTITIPPGGYCQGRIEIIYPESGNKTITFEIDKNNLIKESGEENNKIIFGIEVVKGYLKVISPNGEEKWMLNNYHKIRWNSTPPAAGTGNVICDANCLKESPSGWMDFYFEHDKFSKIEAGFNWTNLPQENNVGIYPAILYTGFEAGSAAYAGPQIILDNKTITKKVLFSIWDSAEGANDATPYSPWCNRFGGEGEGAQCFLPENNWWEENKEYKITIQKDEELSDGAVWKGAIQNIETGEEKLIGKIKLNNAKGYKGFGSLAKGTGGFFEYFGGAHNKCLEAEYGKIIRRSPVVDGKWLPKKATYKNTACITARRYTPQKGVVVEEVGQNVVRPNNEPIEGVLWDLSYDQPLSDINNNPSLSTSASSLSSFINNAINQVSNLNGLNNSSVEAYLEQKEREQFTTVGKIMEAGKGSIGWIGEIDNYGNYPPPGDNYYVRLADAQTGAADRSDAPFSLLPADYIKADAKINGSDGPINIVRGGQNVELSWASQNAEACDFNPGLLGDYYLSNLPPNGSSTIFLKENNYGWDSILGLNCKGSNGIEGWGSDSIVIKANLPDLTITDFKIDPSTPVVNRPAQVSFNLKNIGSANSPWPEIYIQSLGHSLSSEIRFDCSADLGVSFINLSTSTIGFSTSSLNLSQGEGIGLAPPGKIIPPGTSCRGQYETLYTKLDPKGIIITVDPQNVISESDKTNNKIFNNFKVVEGIISVLNPKEGDKLERGKSYNIRWLKDGLIGNQFRVALYKGGEFYKMIDAETPKGSLSVNFKPTVQIPFGHNYKIKVISLKDADVKAFSGQFSIIPPNFPPVIKSITGPQELKVGEVGNWVIKVKDADGEPLTYEIKWGDEKQISQKIASTSSLSIETDIQKAVFSHSYAKAGVYKVKFIVYDSSGLSAQAGLEVEVKPKKLLHQVASWVSQSFKKAIDPLGLNPDYTLTVNNPSAVGGTIFDSTNQINCGNECSANYGADQTVQEIILSANSNPGFMVSWSGCEASSDGEQCVITINDGIYDKTVNVSFQPLSGPGVVCSVNKTSATLGDDISFTAIAKNFLPGSSYNYSWLNNNNLFASNKTSQDSNEATLTTSPSDTPYDVSVAVTVENTSLAGTKRTMTAVCPIVNAQSSVPPATVYITNYTNNSITITAALPNGQSESRTCYLSCAIPYPPGTFITVSSNNPQIVFNDNTNGSYSLTIPSDSSSDSQEIQITANSPSDSETTGTGAAPPTPTCSLTANPSFIVISGSWTIQLTADCLNLPPNTQCSIKKGGSSIGKIETLPTGTGKFTRNNTVSQTTTFTLECDNTPSISVNASVQFFTPEIKEVAPR